MNNLENQEGENIERIIIDAEKSLRQEEERIPARITGDGSKLYNIKKLGLKALLPFISKSPRMQNYFLNRQEESLWMF